MKVASNPMPASGMPMAAMYSALPVSMVFVLIHTMSDLAETIGGLFDKPEEATA